MSIEKVEKIKGLIQQAEIENAKSQGVIENIKKDWLEKYGTDDLGTIEKKLSELKEDLKASNDRRDKLYNDLLNAFDWEQLEEDL